MQKVSPSDSNPWRVFVDWTGTKERVGTPKKAWPNVYAPYVDFTLNTIPDLAALAKNHNVNHFTLAFVVSKDANTCLPTWGPLTVCRTTLSTAKSKRCVRLAVM